MPKNLSTDELKKFFEPGKDQTYDAIKAMLASGLLEKDENGTIGFTKRNPFRQSEQGKALLGNKEYTPYELSSRYIQNPLKKYYENLMTEGQKRSSAIPSKISALEEEYKGANTPFSQEIAGKYESPYRNQVLDVLAKKVKEHFRDDLLPELSDRFIKSGQYGSLLHGKMAERLAKKSEESYEDQASQLLNNAYQQSAQMHAADRESAMNNISQRAGLIPQEQSLRRNEEAMNEAVAQSIQQDKQAKLNAGYARQQEEENRPFQDIANVMNLDKGNFNFGGAPVDIPSYQQKMGVGQGFAKGGSVNLHRAASRLASAGRNGDTELAHINPVEAALLRAGGGRGTINPETGLEEYGGFSLGKLMGFLGPVIGGLGLNFLAPGLGSLLGGGLGGGLAGMFGHPNQRKGLMGGALMGAAAPSAFSGLGKMASGAGMEGTGSILGKLGGSNDMLPSFMTSGGQGGGSGNPLENLLSSKPADAAGAEKGGEGFFGKLNSFASSPAADMALKAAPMALQGFQAYGARQDAQDLVKMQKERQEKEEAMIRAILARQDLTEKEKAEAIKAAEEAEEKRKSEAWELGAKIKLPGRYAHGGEVNDSLHRAASRLASAGRNGDTELAHINPVEAALLRAMGGSGTINPETGLPEYFFKEIGEHFKNLFKGIGNVIVHPIDSIKKLVTHPLDTMKDVVNTVNPWAGKAMGLVGTGVGAALGGPGGAQLGNTLGSLTQNWLNSGKEEHATSQPQPKPEPVQQSISYQPQGNEEGQDYYSGGYDDYGNNQDYGQGYGQDYQDYNSPYQQSYGGQDDYQGYQGYAKGGHVKTKFRNPKSFASGGYVEGDSGGTQDNIPAKIPEGSYVLDATTMSLLGDGNSKAGHKKVEDMLHKIRSKSHSFSEQGHRDGIYNLSKMNNERSKFAKGGQEVSRLHGRMIPALVSSGEYIIKPEDVLLFGNGGSLKEGVKNLDLFREKLKRQKGLSPKRVIPPKTKEIDQYIKIAA